ncbi:MAG: hypothetical protein FJZ98_08680 [Chloroflexi bacterium]|nr:hypothetical protein [Chloroflexota bacterium]
MTEKWVNELDEYFLERKKTKKEINARNEEQKKKTKHFLKKEVIPAFEDLKDELKRYKRDCEINMKRSRAAMVVRHNKKKIMAYEVNIFY